MDLTADPLGADLRVSDRVYAAVAVVAALIAVGQGPRSPLVLGCVLLALVPWGLLLVGREPALPVFAVVSMLPVAVAGATTGLAAVLFMATAASSRVASRTDRRSLLLLTTAAVLVLPVLSTAADQDIEDVGALYFAFGNLFGVLAGVMLRRSARLTRALGEAGEQLAEAAARDERHRIARDVHDLVAHSLTVVVLHVGGARRVLRTDPDAAEGALADAEQVCRESLDGIRGVVGLLREDGDHPPVLSLGLDELVDGYRAAGLPVTLTLRGDPAALPLATRVTLHRVVQEALANVGRHAGTGAATSVEVGVDAGGADVRVSNDLPAPRAAPGHGGFGLLGLVERVASLGGTLSGGPDDGSWVVRCRLPATDRRPARVPTP